MSARRKDFVQRKGNVSPAACHDVGWRGVALTLTGDKWEVGGAQCRGGGPVGERSALGEPRLSPCCPDREK